MKKYVCVGTHGSGKTTLSYLLSAELKKLGRNSYLLQEKVRNSPFPINDKMQIETSLWASSSHIAEELQALGRGFDSLVADRSPYDTFLYAAYYNLKHPVLSTFKRAAFEWLQSYEKIIWVRPDMPLEKDGIRSVDQKFQDGIDSLFSQFFDTFKEIPKEILWTSEIFSENFPSTLAGSLL